MMFSDQQAKVLAAIYLENQLPTMAQTAVSQFLEQYGMRGLAEIDFGRKRWREDPTPIMQILQSYLQITDPDKEPDAMFAHGEEVAGAVIEELVTAVRQTHGGRIKSKLLRAATKRLRALAGLRESPKFFIIQLMGMARELLLESGGTLVDQGVITQADDLFFLYQDELRQLANGQEQGWQKVVTERRLLAAKEEKRNLLPRVLLSDGRVFYNGVTPAEEKEGQLIGSPVSPGIAEGIVHVVFNPHETQLVPGEILVCKGTDPAWTPLFLAAGGLVMEVGGLMTHGSVVAREYGIPAVVGVHDVTSKLTTGQRIRVHGDSGVVQILANGQ